MVTFFQTRGGNTFIKRPLSDCSGRGLYFLQSMNKQTFGIWRKISGLNSLYFLEINKLFLRKHSFFIP